MPMAECLSRLSRGGHVCLRPAWPPVPGHLRASHSFSQEPLQMGETLSKPGLFLVCGAWCKAALVGAWVWSPLTAQQEVQTKSHTQSCASHRLFIFGTYVATSKTPAHCIWAKTQTLLFLLCCKPAAVPQNQGPQGSAAGSCQLSHIHQEASQPRN